MRFLFVILFLMTFYSCTKDKAAVNPCPDQISYSTNIVPAITNTCTTSGCHDATSAGGLNLTTHAAVSANANLILSAIRHDAGISSMPLGGNQWPQTNIDNFKCWLAQGALDN